MINYSKKKTLVINDYLCLYAIDLKFPEQT